MEFNEVMLYQDLVNSLSNNLPDGAFSLREFAKDADLTHSTARRRLDNLVSQGLLGTRKASNKTGHLERYYWILSDDDCKRPKTI